MQSARSQHLTFVETIGRGGFGSVYLAQLRTGRGLVQHVAVKVMHPNQGDDDGLAARQRDEARLLAQLNHDHIVKIFDLVELRGNPALVMEYVAGADCDSLLRRGKLPPRAALQVTAGIASALHAAWSSLSPETGEPLHAIHRDIKPANVLVSESGGVKVLDFGVARASINREVATSPYGTGTMAFMAPELWTEGTFGPGVDIFALGRTLLRLLSPSPVERPPLTPGVFETRVSEHIRAVCDDSWDGAWTAELFALLQQMMAWNPEDRPSAAAVYGRALQLVESAPGESLALYARRAVPAQLEERRRRFELDPPLDNTEITLAAGGEQKAAPTGPNLMVMGAVFALTTLLVVVGGAVGAVLLLRQPAQQPPAPIIAAQAAAAVAPAVVAAPVPTPDPAPAAEPVAPPTPAPRAARSTKPTAPTWPVTIISIPFGAEVLVDGKAAGTTPLQELRLTEGAHKLKLIAPDGRTGDRQIRVGERYPTRFTWKTDEGQWTSGL